MPWTRATGRKAGPGAARMMAGRHTSIDVTPATAMAAPLPPRRVKKAQPNGFPEEDTEEEKRLQRIFDSIPVPDKKGHDEAVSRFVDALESGTEPDATGEDGRNATLFVDAFYLSAATGRTVRLPLTPDSPVYTKAGLAAAMPKFHEKTISTESQQGTMTLGSAAK